jgi:flavin reductase (DIM6/NTAB) family NADH-FMN oxidoreductase RutF
MSTVERLARNHVGGTAASAPHDGKVLRSVFGKFATGVTVVAAGREVPCGMTANSFTSVSVLPPLVLVCVNRTAAIHQAVLESGSFAVSMLSAHQEHIARYFADRSRPRGLAEFDSVDWMPGPGTGSPTIDGALGWLDCSLAASYDGGDHAIFLGSVLASGCGPAHDPLLFFGGFHRPQLVPPALRETA